MPSVGMRRSTRVFVPKSVVKDSDVVRVLRSGKLFSTESVVGKHGRRNNDEWFELYDDSGDDDIDRGWQNFELDPVAESDSEPEPEQDFEMADLDVKENDMSCTDESRWNRFGAVYNRKRRKSLETESNLTMDRKYGYQYTRKKRRIGEAGYSSNEISTRDGISDFGIERRDLIPNSVSDVGVSGRESFTLGVILEFSSGTHIRFTRFLVSVFKFMRLSPVRLPGLAAFLCSEPIAGVFSENGIHFMHDSFRRISWENETLSYGCCQFFGAQNLIPLFSLNYSAIPLTFMSLHLNVILQSLCLPDVLLRFLMDSLREVLRVTGNNRCVLCIPSKGSLQEANKVSNSSSLTKKKLDFTAGDTGLLVDSFFTKYGAKSGVRRKRSILRTKKVKSPSPLGFPILSQSSAGNQVKAVNVGDKVHRSLNPLLLGVGELAPALSTPGTHQKQSKPCRKSPSKSCKEVKAPLAGSNQNVDSLCCNASVLAIESDRCYRVDAVKVTLECFSSNAWYLVVKKQGVIKYTHKAQEPMKPNTFNRYTHALIWTGEDCWKLEFPDRQDWTTFKELHKECISRNVQVQSAKTIPVPGVREVAECVDGERLPYLRPDSYITTHSDEVARALVKRSANYDIDLADEEWLYKLNSSPHDGVDGTIAEYVSTEKFEELIDVFERAAYHNPGSVFDENKAINLCSNLGRKETVAAVYYYWHKKRKHKREALIRVFQCPPPKKAQEMQDKVLRKRRSFKKQPSLSRKGRDQLDLEALAAEKEQEILKAVWAVEEAVIDLNKANEHATLKRRKAEKLMENADLATYRAVMALRIAEVAQSAETRDASDLVLC